MSGVRAGSVATRSRRKYPLGCSQRESERRPPLEGHRPRFLTIDRTIGGKTQCIAAPPSVSAVWLNSRRVSPRARRREAPARAAQWVFKCFTQRCVVMTPQRPTGHLPGRRRQAQPAVAAWSGLTRQLPKAPVRRTRRPARRVRQDAPPSRRDASGRSAALTTPLAKLKLGVEDLPLFSGGVVPFGAALQGNRTRWVALRGTHLDQLPQPSTSTRAREMPETRGKR